MFPLNRVRAFLVVSAAALLLFAACSANGKDNRSARTSPEGGSTGAESASSTPDPNATVVRVTLTEFGIKSSLTKFKIGVPYHFVVTNAGCATHELMIMQPISESKTPLPGFSNRGTFGPGMMGATSGMMGGMYCDGSGMPWAQMFPNEVPMSQLDEMALATVEEDDLHPGQTQALDFTFTRAYPAGSLEMACHLPGHYEMGMELPVTVS